MSANGDSVTVGGDAGCVVAVAIVNYNGLRTVLETIQSLKAQHGVDVDIMVVDDGSTDGSPDRVAATFPDVRIHREPNNTKDVNRLRNIGLRAARTPRVFVVDNDVTFAPACLSELMRVMDSERDVAVCVPRMMYADEPEVVYMAGGRIHYAGATIAPGRHDPYDGRDAPRPAIGGGIALFDRARLEQIGGFDEDYRLAWGDDIDAHQRLLLAGYRSYYVPTAVCLHEYKRFDRTRAYRARWQVRNRWRYLLSHYELRTLLLVSPALVLYELMQASFLLAKGLPHLYVTGTLDALGNLPSTLRKRREIQAQRRIPDREVVFAGPLYVRPEHTRGGRAVEQAVGGLSRLLEVYWRVIQPALKARPALPRQSLAERRPEA